MRLEEVTAEIRPRSDWEAIDLGFAMARRDFWRCVTVWWLAMAVPSAIGIALLWDYPLGFLLIFWWLRVAGTRMVLFELSRRLFGEKPSWKQVWPELPRAWWRRFFYRFIWARFSPWRPLTMAVEDLEGLRGNSYSLRSRLLLRRGDSACFRLSLFGLFTSAWLTWGVLMLMLRLIPDGLDGTFGRAQDAIKAGEFDSIPVSVWWMAVAAAMLSISLTDIFVTGAGFGIYVNNRTWIEGWDVELAFKRLVNRIGKIAAVFLACAALCFPSRAAAADRSPESVIRQVKSSPEFEVQKKRVRDPAPASKSSSSSSSSSSYSSGGSRGRSGSSSGVPWDSFMGTAGTMMLYLVLAAVLAGLCWLLWRYRDAFKRGDHASLDERDRPRIVMGMEITPESLPEDIPTTAWRWWREGRRHEALALLYRGAISKAIELGRVEIAESDTEGDCLRRVNEAGPLVHPGYFGGLTGFWIALAYARTLPGDAEVESLCRQWPYVEGRPA